jgi:hypothetical protein
MTNQTDNIKGAVTAYPLAWPAGWKRTDPGKQRRAHFSSVERGAYRRQRELSIADAIERVLDELRTLRVSRESAIISTNLVLRNDGLPRSDQRPPADQGVAVYWTRAGQPQRCMAIDQYDRVADNLAAIAATLDAMRAIERHGGAEILDRAFTGFAALPAPASTTWRTVLGVGPAATIDDVRTAYRDACKRHHPDAGGSAETFLVVQKAWDEAEREFGL